MYQAAATYLIIWKTYPFSAAGLGRAKPRTVVERCTGSYIKNAANRPIRSEACSHWHYLPMHGLATNNKKKVYATQLSGATAERINRPKPGYRQLVKKNARHIYSTFLEILPLQNWPGLKKTNQGYTRKQIK